MEILSKFFSVIALKPGEVRSSWLLAWPIADIV